MSTMSSISSSSDDPAARRVLLSRLLEEACSANTSEQPLSHAQRMLWFFHQLAPESSVYNVGQAIRLNSPIDHLALERAFEQLIARHPVLRTTFRSLSGAPVALVHPIGRLEFSFVDGRGISSSELDRALEADLARPFDLEHGPLLRVVVYEIEPNEHVLLLAMHHIIGEFWSLIILVREVADLYTAAREGRQLALAKPSRIYANFVAAEQRKLDSEEGDRLWAYWRQKLSGDLPVLDLPTDRPRPTVQTYAGAHLRFSLNPTLAAELLAFARQSGTTPFVVLLAAFVLQLARYTNKRDVIVGTPFTGRTSPEWADVIGYFDNPLPIRVDLSDSPTFGDIVQRVRRAVLEAFEHQALPLPVLAERLHPERDSSRPAIFNTMLVFRRAQKGAEGLASLSMGDESSTIELASGMSARAYPVKRHAAPLDLALVLGESAGRIRGYWEYNTDLFDEPTVARFTGHLERLLSEGIASPDMEALKLRFLTDAERNAALVEWNSTAKAFPVQHVLLQAPFETNAAARPTATAIVAGGRTYSYAWVASASDRVARWLQDRGARPGQLIAIVMNKGWQQIVAALGVTRSGAAYLPIDAQLPRERIHTLLTLGEVSLVLAQANTKELALGAGMDLLIVEEASLDSLEAGAKPCPACPEDLAYVIFTSGSTGTPKGVMIEHRAALNTILDVNERFSVHASDRVLALSSLSFDLSVYDLFGTLAAGGVIVVPDADRVHDPAHWADLVAAEHVTLWNSVPGLADLVAGYAERTRPDVLVSLRTIMLSGDWIPLALPSRLRVLAPRASIVSLGGATEASIWSIFYPIGEIEPSWRSIPYGRPMSNQSCYVLDDNLEPCPIGVVGELYIGGAGVARGYWADEERTKHSFVRHAARLERLYRTGDLGRYQTGGLIELLGRRDNQVKIRGFRIELGEIEAALIAVPEVERTVVCARRKDGKEGRLVAYVVPKHDAVLTSTYLRSTLERRLPDYMVPNTFVVLTSLPLSANGKVALDALPEPSQARPPLAATYRAPTTDMERLFAAIWSRLLDVDDVGIDDGFFELGGDSVLAIQISSLARESGISVTPRQIFETPTIAALSRVALRTAVVAPAAVVRLISTIQETHPLSPMQNTMLLHSIIAGTRWLYCERIICELRGLLDSGAFARAVSVLADAHPVLRSRFVLTPEPGQIVDRNVDIPVRELDWRHRADEEARAAFDALLEDERVQGFDPETAPLVRLVLVRFSDDFARLVIVHHHVLFDGWSLSPLLRDLLDLHDRELGRTDRGPTPQRPSFFDYVEWHAKRDAVRDEAFWREELRGVSRPSSLLGVPNSSSLLSRFEHAELEYSLSASASRALTAFARENGVTQSTIVLAAWAFVLGQYSGDDEIVCGMTVGGRPVELPAMRDAIGLFINTLPIRVSLLSTLGVVTWLQALQHRQAAAREHDGLPLAAVQRLSADHISDGSFGLFESVVVFENYPVDPCLRDSARRLRVEDIRFQEETGTPLTLYAFPDAALRLRLSYDKNRFDREDVASALRHVAIVLERIATAPADAVLLSLSLVDRESEPRIRRTTTAPAASVLAEIYHVASTAPDVVAVEDGEQTLTYAELVRRAQGVAGALQAIGVQPSETVAIAVPRSLEMITSVLGTLQAGAAYLPVDLAWPADRLRVVLEMAKVKVAIASAGDRARFKEVRVIHPEQVENAAVDLCPITTLPSPSAPAYVICTSGSTGEPKGTVVSHGALDAFVASARAVYSVQSRDRVLQFNALAFDASVEELFVTFAVGATLVLRSEDMIESAKAFWDGCTKRQVDVVSLPTSFWHVLMADLANSIVSPSVRVLILGGESARKEAVCSFLDAIRSNIRLLNTYGPTETTVVATVSDLGRWKVAGARGRVPIGTSLPHVCTYVLDRELRPVASGVPGELAIGGPGLATRYVGRPDLTAQAFVTLDLAGEKVRVYRTGDRVRLRADGELDFLGRVDRQVKVRGFRVELEEIEVALSAHEDVARAAVIATDEEGGSRRLVAFVLPRSGSAPTEPMLRAFVASRVPNFMVPSQVVVVVELPLTVSGKVDPRRLRVPAPVVPAMDNARTPIERTVGRIWAEALRVSDLGRNDDFFDRGGNSLLAVVVAARCREALGLDVQLRTVFQYPTVSAFASALATVHSNHPPTPNEALFVTDAMLPEDIRPVGSVVTNAPSQPTRAILLTGATGFLGAFLVGELLRLQPSLDVYCLVRAASEGEARSRVLAAMDRYGIRSTGDARRLIPICGDLALPSFGLVGDRVRYLATNVDAILHNGALVHGALSYEKLRATNVDGTREVLRLAAHRNLPVHFVSTLSVFDDEEGEHEFTELTWPSGPRATASGYAKSKIVAEFLAREAQARGMPVALYRPSAIIGDTLTGACQSGDVISMLMAACVATGSFPATEHPLELVPVDHVSRAIVELALDGCSPGRAFHLTGARPTPISRVGEWMTTFGFSLRALSYSTFRSRVQAWAHGAGREHPATSLVSMLPAVLGDEKNFDARATRARLAALGQTVPTVNELHIHRHLQFLVDTGALPPPESNAGEP